LQRGDVVRDFPNDLGGDAMTAVSVTRTPGRTLYAFPDGFSLADWTTHRVLLVEGTGANTGSYTASLDESKSLLWRFFDGASQPSNWGASKGYFDLADGIALDTLLTRTSSGVNVTVTSPVAETGQLKELIIGDDYLVANDRALVWTFPAIAGMSIGDATATLGVRRGTFSTSWSGSVGVGAGGSWVATIQIGNDEWDGVTQGLYEYSLEITDGVNTREITRVINDVECKVFLRNKAT
jgi:hypothetical protein